MASKTLSVIGWDIGGVNIKAAKLVWRSGERLDRQIILRPFEIWRELQRLPAVLAEIGEELGITADCSMALTMTAELSDAFRNKREGVQAILDAAAGVFPNIPIYPLSLTGDFMLLTEARRQPEDFAASNWLASGLYVALKHPDCIHMDVGSTTTDIIPIRKGRVVCTGRTDMDRLTSGELVYTGILRTNPNAIVGRVPVHGRMCRVSAEFFAQMADVYLLLGFIPPEGYTCPTPDGRAKSRQAAVERLSRLVCADAEMLNEEQIVKISKYLYEQQLRQIMEALCQVLSMLDNGCQLPLAVAGAGAFLATEAGRRLGLSILDLVKGPDGEDGMTLPAHAAAYLLARKISRENS